MTNPLLNLQNISLSLQGAEKPVEILRDVSLSVLAGEKIALIGPSGSGKTSLMMIMAGLQDATSGQVIFDDTDILSLNENERAQLRRAKIGIVFQNFHLIPTMTALENTRIPLELAHIDDKDGLAVQTLQSVGLGHRLDHYPAQLSGGEQQRVALARALVTKPKLLLADEPTGNLDGKTGAQIIDLLFTLTRDHGSTLILITHDLGLAARCDRQIHLQDGQVIHV